MRNNRLNLLLLSGCVISGFTGALNAMYNEVTEDKSGQVVSLPNITTQALDWVEAINAVSQFAPKTKNDSIQTDSNKQVTINDSTLVGIVESNPPTILVVVHSDDSGQPVIMKLGDMWLENWNLSNINPDSVTWTNSATSEQFQQYLFSVEE